VGSAESGTRTALSVTRTIVFTPTARSELIAAQDWYENEADGLGRRFRTEAGTAIERILLNPLQFPAVYKNVRRALLRHFPYMLFFVVEGDSLAVIACFHASRGPQEWQKRG
jgi:toxin ParE1/3/4